MKLEGMASIQQLLNPLNTPPHPPSPPPPPPPPPPQRQMSPAKRKRGRNKGEDTEMEEEVVSLGGKEESFTPVLREEMPASRDDQSKGKERDIEITSVEEKESLSPSTRQRFEGADTGKIAHKETPVMEDGVRRVSSSSLADILNPTDVSPKTLSNDILPQSIPRETLAKIPSSDTAAVNEPQESGEQPTQQKPTDTTKEETQTPNDAAETEDEMLVDVVTTGEKGETSHLDKSESTTTDIKPMQSAAHDMQRSDSYDSQATIEDPIDSTTVQIAADASPVPLSSPKKRKFTPESSPDEPLSHGVPQVPRSTTEDAEVQSQISVEKPQPPVRAIKKPKKQPVPKKPAAKRKPLNGLKRPSKPKRAEKLQSVGLDDDHAPSTRQSSVTPSIASTSSYDSSTRNSKAVYCICRKPDRGSWMIGCETCEDWFHGSCVHIDESDEPLIDKYICPTCEEKGKGKTVWLRKCRLPGCKKPAIAPVRGTKGVKGTKGSKYCCDEHGVQFFKSRLNKLDPETLTKPQLKAVLGAMKGIEEFKVLGDVEPTIPESVLAKFRTPEDDSRLTDLRLEREKISRKIEIVELRRSFLHLVVEKAKQLNADLKSAVPQQLAVGKNKTKSKAKEICGFDDRLSLDDAEFLEWSASPEGKVIFTEKIIEDDKQCDNEKRRCRHVGWQALRGEDILMEESLLRSQLEGIALQEKLIKERQKVRARNASPGNGQAIQMH